jgi:pimeloyl-ACP methyl ester carboxylesterase
VITPLAVALLTMVGTPQGHGPAQPVTTPPPSVHATHENVAVVLHGLSSTVLSFSSTEPGSGLIAGLRAQGWYVIVPEEPYRTVPALIKPALADGGYAYRAAWDADFAGILAVNEVPSNANLMVVGISWGGLHALMAACDDTAVSEVVVHDPVVDASNLAEFAGMSLPGLSVTSCAKRFASMRGEMSYGTLDTRVGVAPSQALAESIVSPTMSVVREVEGHETTAADVATMLVSTALDLRGVPVDPRLPKIRRITTARTVPPKSKKDG